MAHSEQLDFVYRVKQKFPHLFENVSVLEIGSYNVNGSVRCFFINTKKYVGVDLCEGKDVDVVSYGHLYKSPTLFDVSISCETFEHDKYWNMTFKNMCSLTRSGGLVIFTCATNLRKEHGTPRTTPNDSLSSKFYDYYRNLWIEDFLAIMDFNVCFFKYSFEVNGDDLYFWGIKK